MTDEDWKENSLVYLRCSICNEFYYIFDIQHVFKCRNKPSAQGMGED